jgi:hypothetical protein
MSAETIIRLYSLRFKIECTFKELNQVVGAFDYHFWTSSMEKLNYYQKSHEPGPLENITDERALENIIKTIQATELHVLIGCISLGLLQMTSLIESKDLNLEDVLYYRTYSNRYASEALIKEIVSKRIFFSFASPKEFAIIEKIRAKQKHMDFRHDSSDKTAA